MRLIVKLLIVAAVIGFLFYFVNWYLPFLVRSVGPQSPYGP